MEKKKVQAVLFDFDGVICQTETYRLDRKKKFLEQFGLAVDMRRLYSLAGGTRHGREAAMDRLYGDQEAYRRNREEILAYRFPEAPYAELRTPGVKEVLQRLKEKGIGIGVASNSSEEMLELGLSECQVRSYIDVIVSGWDTERRKPDPYVYQEAMERLHVTPEQCVVVEDSELGIRAGKAAGCMVIALKDRDGMIDQSRSDAVIERIEQLLDYLKIDE